MSKLMLGFGMLLLACGCATTGGDARDPFEGFNRSMYGFNQAVDQAVLKPVAQAYKQGLPEIVQTGVRNFFSNLADVFISVNNLLQGKVIEAANDGMRFAVNTTIGGLGLLDWASEMGLEKHNEDFGQTFGRWGVGDGPYIVWPVFGSSTARDSVGGVFDIAVDPVSNHKPVAARNAMNLVRLVGKRADLLDASRLLEEAALDKYVFERDAYLQRRRNLVFDGNPPREAASLNQSSETGDLSEHSPVQTPAQHDAVLSLSGQAEGERLRVDGR
ncbi:MAG TPA: VacJ family lipoprotein [Pyrinomonadaceae bacterium]|nr:VacJ family lipoprotein [Pyrinomonadaceae bacterium]